MTKVCIWGAWYESENAGDQAILMTIARLLAQELPDLELVVFSNRPAFTEEYMRPVYPVRALSQRHSLPAALRELRTCDLFLVGGGTPFYDDWFHLAAMLLLTSTARTAGTPVMTYAVSARPINSPAGRWLARRNLRLMHPITVRETQAVSRMQELGAKPPIHLFTDPALTLDPVGDAEALALLAETGISASEGDRALIALCPHFFSATHEYHVHHYEAYSAAEIDNYHRALAAAADRLVQHGTVFFLPMNTEAPDDDRETIAIVRALMAHGDRTHAIARQFGPRQIAGILRHCELSLAVRLHAAVLSTAVYTPTVAVSYGPKVIGYMTRIGQAEHVVEMSALTADSLVAALAAAWPARAATRQALHTTMAAMRNLAAANAKLAASCVKAR